MKFIEELRLELDSRRRTVGECLVVLEFGGAEAAAGQKAEHRRRMLVTQAFVTSAHHPQPSTLITASHSAEGLEARRETLESKREQGIARKAVMRGAIGAPIAFAYDLNGQVDPRLQKTIQETAARKLRKEGRLAGRFWD